MKYFIETYGCQMNVHDSERMAGLLEQSGYDRAETDARRRPRRHQHLQRARARRRQALYAARRIKEMGREPGRDPIVAVTGCVAQQEGAEAAQALAGVDRPRRRHAAGQDAADARASRPALGRRATLAGSSRRRRRHPYEEPSFPLGITRRGDPVRAYVTIIEGCNDFCAFCVVPYTRGHERMRSKAEILADVREAAASGRRKCSCSGRSSITTRRPTIRPATSRRCSKRSHEIPGIERIRFASPHPRHTSERLIAAVRDLPKVCKHLHLPVQSGSTRVLGRMRRRHTREEYLDLVARIRAGYPERAAIDRYDRWLPRRDRRRTSRRRCR